MSEENSTPTTTQPTVTKEEVDRVLEVGRLLFSVLTPEEIEELQTLLGVKPETGNTGVT